MASEVQFKRFGKKPKREDKRTLQFKNYATAVTPPATVDFYSKVTSWPMMGNDVHGDCTCAAAGHMIEEWTTYASAPVVLPDATILAFYNVVDGGVDDGADMLTVLNTWRQQGIGGHKIDSFVELGTGSINEIQQAVYLFGNAYLGIELPDTGEYGPWTVTYGPPDPNNGHCVPVVGYDAENVYVVSWGSLMAMSYAFVEEYCDEAYAVLSPDWIEQSNVAPSGFNLAQLQTDLTTITQNAPPNPSPPSGLWAWIVAGVLAGAAAIGVWLSGFHL